MVLKSAVVLVILAGVVTGAAVAQDGSPLQVDKDAVVRGLFAKAADDTEEKLAKHSQDLGVRDVEAYAFYLAVARHDGAAAEKLIRLTWTLQDMNPKSATYGAIGWNLYNDKINDANSIDFGTHFWGPLVLGYAKELSPQFLSDMKIHASAALQALQRHKVAISYTNIFLMNTNATILLAQFTGDTAQAQRGKQQLVQWLQYVNQYGNHEFDTPFYYAEDLSDLPLLAHYTNDAAVRGQAVAAMDYLWKDVALNSQPGIRRPILGSNSRDYSFVGHVTSGITVVMWYVGLYPTFRPTGVDMSKAGQLDYLPAGYKPDAAKLRSLIPPTRVVTQRWSEKPDQIRYTYFTPDFSVGTASGDYGPQDRMFAVDFASKQELPVITIVPDRFDGPYGLKSQVTKDKSGHEKNTHVPLHPVFLQKEGSVLTLLDLNPAGEDGLETLGTNILLPVKADEMRVGSKKVDPSSLSKVDASPDDVVGVRVGPSCFAFRFPHVDPLGGTAPVFQLKGDSGGKSVGAVRFVVYHMQHSQGDLPKHLRVMMISETAACPAQGLPGLMDKIQHANASFDRKDGQINVQTTMEGSVFAVSMKDDSRTASTLTVDGVTPHTAPLAFDGHAVTLLPPAQPAPQ